MSVKDIWPPKRPGPVSDSDGVTRQTLREGMCALPPEKPYLHASPPDNSATASASGNTFIITTGCDAAAAFLRQARTESRFWYGMVWYGMVW